jgi:uncharacterized protein YndB with AHSA1/START domain
MTHRFYEPVFFRIYSGDLSLEESVVMGPVHLTTSVEISAPRDAVFAAFTDFPKSATILHSASSTDFQTSQTTGLNAEWVQYAPESEGRSRAVHKIIAFQPDDFYIMTTDDPNSFETMEFRFMQENGVTIVSFDLKIQPKGFFKGLFLRLARPFIRGFMKADLERMKTVIENS